MESEENADFRWEYQVENLKWCSFSPSLSAQIEELYLLGEKSAIISPVDEESEEYFIFEINFTEMHRIDLSTQTAVRIQRIELAKKALNNGEPDRSANEPDPIDEQKKEELFASITRMKPLAENEIDKSETCVICQCDVSDGKVVELGDCSSHRFHKDCILAAFRAEDNFFQCPVCRKVYGIKLGTRPYGSMSVHFHAVGVKPCEGFKGFGTIEIEYQIPNGLQGPHHPHPGVPFTGNERITFMPDTPEARDLLRRLEIAWDRKFLFTVGRSVTTGEDNTVVWSGAHHKTSCNGGIANYGWPDDTYFQRVSDELTALGIN